MGKTFLLQKHKFYKKEYFIYITFINLLKQKQISFSISIEQTNRHNFRSWCKKMFSKKQQPLIVGFDMHQLLGNQFGKQKFNPSSSLNHQFFLLVRDKQYVDAYILGQKLLKEDPYNSAVANFCDFIKNNMQDLLKMRKDQEQYTDDEQEYSQDDEQDDDQEEDDQQSEQQSQAQQTERKQKTDKKQKTPFKNSTNSILSKPSQKTSVNSSSISNKSLKSDKKLQLPQINSQKKVSSSNSNINIKTSVTVNKQNAHKWEHNCKNPNCPNKNKPHRHSGNSSNGVLLLGKQK